MTASIIVHVTSAKRIESAYVIAYRLNTVKLIYLINISKAKLTEQPLEKTQRPPLEQLQLALGLPTRLPQLFRRQQHLV